MAFIGRKYGTTPTMQSFKKDVAIPVFSILVMSFSFLTSRYERNHVPLIKGIGFASEGGRYCCG
jgi:hypothetical protein